MRLENTFFGRVDEELALADAMLSNVDQPQLIWPIGSKQWPPRSSWTWWTNLCASSRGLSERCGVGFMSCRCSILSATHETAPSEC